MHRDSPPSRSIDSSTAPKKARSLRAKQPPRRTLGVEVRQPARPIAQGAPRKSARRFRPRTAARGYPGLTYQGRSPDPFGLRPVC